MLSELSVQTSRTRLESGYSFKNSLLPNNLTVFEEKSCSSACDDFEIESLHV